MKSLLKNKFIQFAFLFIVLFTLFILDLFSGSISIPISSIFDLIGGNSIPEEWKTILFEFRIPRVITAILAGVALSISGLQMQTLFRNPLAGPDVLGVTSGASLGVALLVISLSAFGFSGISSTSEWGIAFAAFAGSIVTILIIFIVSLRIRDSITLLILGILIASATTSIVSILQYFSPESSLKVFVIWTLGSLGGVSQSQLLILLICVISGLILSIFFIKKMDAFLLGENYAKSMGINVKQTRILIFICTSILAGTITAFCGPIGFIGVIVPHISRIYFRTTRNIILMPATAIIGACVMLLSDLLTQLPPNDIILPINSVTALIGIPFIIILIIKNNKMSQLV